MGRPIPAALHIVALAVACARPEDGPATRWNTAPPPPPRRRSPNGWVLVDRALQATSGMARGVGEVITLGTGGVFRVTGNVVRSVGASIDAVGNAVAGESSRGAGSAAGDYAGDGSGHSTDATGATRRLLSRPMRVVSTTFKSVGDGITVLGDATERMAGEALGIVPDAFGVLQSGVGALRKRVEFDVNDSGQDWRSVEAGEAEKGRSRDRAGGGGNGGGGGRAYSWMGTPHGPPAAGGSTSRGARGRGNPGAEGGNGRASPRESGGAGDPLPSARGSSKTKQATPNPDGAVERRALDEFIGPRATPHVALALLCLALCARVAGGGPFGLLAAAACGVACVGYLRAVEAAQQGELMRVAEARALRGWQLRVGAPAESVGWLNTILAAGWETTFGPYLHETIRESLVESLRQLTPTLPRTLASIQLWSLNVGRQPPLLVSISAAQTPGPSPNPQPGAAAVVEFELDAPDAHLEFEFRFANIASRPRLRIARPRLRGTLRLHWEWIQEYPHVGRVRWTFLSPPAVDAGLEPLGGIDVTQLPAVGPFIFWTLRSNLLASCVYPAWVTTDMRTSTLDASAAIAAAIASATADEPLADREEKKAMELVEEEAVNRALAGVQPRASRRQSRRDHPIPRGHVGGSTWLGAGKAGGGTAAASTLGLTPAPPLAVYPGGMSRRLHERLAAAAARAAAGDSGVTMGVVWDNASRVVGRGGGGGVGRDSVVEGGRATVGGVAGAGTGVGTGAGADVAGGGSSASDAEDLPGISPTPLLVRGIMPLPPEMSTPATNPSPTAISPISPARRSSSYSRDQPYGPTTPSAAGRQPSPTLSTAHQGVRSTSPANTLSRAWRMFRLGGPPLPTGIPSAGASVAGAPAGVDGDTGGGGGRPERGELPPTTLVSYRLDRAGRLVPSTSRADWAGRGRGGVAARSEGRGGVVVRGGVGEGRQSAEAGGDGRGG